MNYVSAWQQGGSQSQLLNDSFWVVRSDYFPCETMWL